MSTPTIFLTRDNATDLAMIADQAAVPAASFTRFILKLFDKNNVLTTIDSNTAPAGTFSTTKQKVVRGTLVSLLTIKLGLGSFGLAQGDYACRLVVYDVNNPDGLVWGDTTFRARVNSGI